MRTSAHLGVAAALVMGLGGCSFFQEHEYSTCEVDARYIPCNEEAGGFTLIETGDKIDCGWQITVNGESASGQEQKEVELPAL